MYRWHRIRQILELNGIAHSEAAGTHPMEVVWSLAQQYLHESQPVTIDCMRDKLAVFWTGPPQSTINSCIDEFVATVV